jgi:hypothetical protein
MLMFSVEFHVLLINLKKSLRYIIATLALGSRPRQGFAKVWAKSEARESHLMLPEV